MTTARKIAPHLWFDKEAKEAAEFYVSIFPGSKLEHLTTLRDTPSGDCDIVAFELAGQAFVAISAGPLFKPNPSISFIVNCTTAEELDTLWEKLSAGGQALMPLDAYPFSERFGWIEDRFRVSWQLTLSGTHDDGQPTIVPSLMFVGTNCGKAEEAIHFYTSVFRTSKIGQILRYGPGQAPAKDGTIMFADFILENQRFAIADSAGAHDFAFSEAISLLVNCDTQEEIDYYWEQLSAVPEAEQCGWLKDRYGLSWQITPAALDEMMRNGSSAQIERITQAFLKMKKFDIAALQRAYAAR